MGRIFLAFKTFFRVLGSSDVAAQVKRIGGPVSEAPMKPVAESKPVAPPAPPKKVRSDALTLLETLQREARLLDFLYEDINSYNDAQVGAAVREVHRETQAVLQRLFAIGPVDETPEGSQIEVAGVADSARMRLIGNVTDARPVSGELVHAGWQVTKCELPNWNGNAQNEWILAPAEVEIR